MLRFSLRTVYCGYKTYVSLLTNNFLWVFWGGNYLCSWLFIFALLLHGFSFPCCLSQTIIFTSSQPITATQHLLCYVSIFYLHITEWISCEIEILSILSPLGSFETLWFHCKCQGVWTLTFNIGLPEIDAVMRTAWLWCRTALSSDSINGHWSPSCLN